MTDREIRAFQLLYKASNDLTILIELLLEQVDKLSDAEQWKARVEIDNKLKQARDKIKESVILSATA